LLSRTVHGKPLVYFDNANTSQKPVSVIEAVDTHYREHNANVARAVHQLGRGGDGRL
jgi:cysteine desulfurase/selenocysteine lyase